LGEEEEEVGLNQKKNVKKNYFQKKRRRLHHKEIALDEDDHHKYTKYSGKGIIYDIGPAPKLIGVNEKLNRIANQVKNDYDYIIWAADDTVPMTYAWDEKLVNAIKDVPMGISYPNDTIQKERFPSNGTCFDIRIPKVLGYIAPPTLFHLYMDNFWKLLGEELGTLRYREDVILEHNHFVNKKAPPDKTYMSINSKEMYTTDSQSFEVYRNHELRTDVSKLVKSLEK
jgi:hypothetical protein